MNNVDILLYLAIFYILYLVANGKPNNTDDSEEYENSSRSSKRRHNRNRNNKEFFKPNTVDDPYLNDLVHELKSWDGDGLEKIEKRIPNQNFLDTKFHNDYRDIMTALNNLVPSQKQLFNLPNIPVDYSEADPDEVFVMAADLIRSINQNVVDEVPACRNNNSGWDEAIPDPNMESGWDKFMKNLGLTPSLYDKPTHGKELRLFQVDKVHKYETEDEVKYVCFLILDRPGVEDQMILKAAMVQDKRPLNNEDNFFVSKDIEMRVAIEELTIVGYLSNYGMDANKQYANAKKDYYNIDNMERNNLTDPKYVIHELEKRHRKIQKEMDYRNSLLDEDGQDFHRNIPHPYDYSSYQVTRTIYDDINEPKKRFV